MAVQIVQKFQSVAEKIQEHAANYRQALDNSGRPSWFLPEGAEGISPQTDPESVSRLFDRNELENAFSQVVAGDGGTTGDLAVIVLQGSFLQSAEAAFRSSYMSFVRSAAHAAARARGHAHPQGPLQRAYINYVQFLAAKSAGG